MYTSIDEVVIISGTYPITANRSVIDESNHKRTRVYIKAQIFRLKLTTGSNRFCVRN